MSEKINFPKLSNCKSDNSTITWLECKGLKNVSLLTSLLCVNFSLHVTYLSPIFWWWLRRSWTFFKPTKKITGWYNSIPQSITVSKKKFQMQPDKNC